MKIRKVIFLLFISFFTKLNSQTWVNIPDPNFAYFLQTHIPTAMSGNSLNITNTIVTTGTHTMNLWNQNISSLNGIQYFTSLTYLNCMSNSLSTLPLLPNSTQTIHCELNNLTSIPILPNSLQALYCGGNYSLTNLPSLPNTLKDLNCSQTGLVSLPVLPNSLLYLYCSENYLTNLPSLPNSLKVLNCWNNSLSSLPSLPNTLIDLICNFNYSISSLPTLPNNLETLNCSVNALTSLPVLPNSLKVLYCDNNNIKCFPTFPNSILPAGFNSINVWTYYISLTNNPFNCLPNYLPASMDMTTLSYPLCSSGNSNGCQVATDIKDHSINNLSLKITPNPSSEILNIKYETLNDDDVNIQLLNALGQILVDEKMISQRSSFNIQHFNSGMYFVKIIQNDKLIATQKFIKK